MEYEAKEKLATGVSVDEESDIQYKGTLGVTHIIRRILYDKSAYPPVGFIEDIDDFIGIDGEFITALELKGHESVLDVGCGDGRLVKLLAQGLGHTGDITGLNNDADHYIGNKALLAEYSNVNFQEADARELPFEDNSFDVVTQNFILYHIDNPGVAIDEALRVLKPGGKLLIATRDPGNQKRLWGFIYDIADELKEMTARGETLYTTNINGVVTSEVVDYSKVVPPEIFYNRFDMSKTKTEMQQRGLKIKKEFMQSSAQGNSIIKLTPNENDPLEPWWTYEFALNTLINSYGGALVRGGHMKKAIEKLVKPVFDSEIATKGYFEEYIEQGFVVVEKPTN